MPVSGSPPLARYKMEWSQPEIRGDSVRVRAGHAGVSIDENWYIVGGGDNTSGSPETLVLDTSKLVWSVVTSVEERAPLASEGLSVCSALVNGKEYMIAFGGYYGKYSNEVFVMRPKLRDSTLPKIYLSPAAAASVTAAYALSKSENSQHHESRGANLGNHRNHSFESNNSNQTNVIREEKKAMELQLGEGRVENTTLKGKLEEVNNTYAELSKEHQSVQGQLVTERSRCFNLESQIAEMKKMMASFQSIEEEVQSLRRQKPSWEHNIELASAAERQGSGGVWNWIAGST